MGGMIDATSVSPRNVRQNHECARAERDPSITIRTIIVERKNTRHSFPEMDPFGDRLLVNGMIVDRLHAHSSPNTTNAAESTHRHTAVTTSFNKPVSRTAMAIAIKLVGLSTDDGRRAKL